MSKHKHAQLNPWNDADNLLAALAQVGRDDIADLTTELIALLAHEDADIREEAMRALFVRGISVAFRSRAIASLGTDPTPEVRAVSAYALAATSSTLTLDEDTARLVGVLERADEDAHVRATAYDCLLLIDRRPQVSFGPGEFDAARDADWGWTRQVSAR